LEIIIANVGEKEKKEWIKQSNFKKETLEKVIHINDGLSFVAKYKDEYIGIISIYIKDVFENNEELKEAYIDVIEVKEQYRRMKVGRRLLDKVIEFSRENNLYQIRAWSTLDKKKAIKLWEAAGFSFTPITMNKNGIEISGVYVGKLI